MTQQPQWVLTQKKTFTKWANVQLDGEYLIKDVEKDLEGLYTMRVLGKNMAFMIKSISLGKEKFGLPEKEAPKITNFIR